MPAAVPRGERSWLLARGRCRYAAPWAQADGQGMDGWRRPRPAHELAPTSTTVDVDTIRVDADCAACGLAL